MPTLLRSPLSVLSIALVACFLASCASNSKDELGPDGEVVKSSLSRSPATNVPLTDLDSLVRSNNRFAGELFAKIAGPDANVFFSPYSVSIALAMTWAGARNETESAMDSVLHFGMAQDHLHGAFNKLDLAIDSRNDSVTTIKTANALWGERTLTFETPFLDRLAVNYGAGMHVMDFLDAPDDSRLTINTWVSERTVHKIEDLLPAGSITPSTALVLTNAIYFKAKWAEPFKTQSTGDTTFRRLDGTTVSVPMMNAIVPCGYHESAGLQVVDLPYKGNAISMMIVVPSGTVDDAEQVILDEMTYETVCAGLSGKSVQLALPRFKFTSASISLTDALTSLGMGVAFGGSADFSGMTKDDVLCIGDVLHKAFVSVDEFGTEAAAATAVVMVRRSMPLVDATVRADRPFVFLIRDRATGAVLFAGKIVDPTVQE